MDKATGITGAKTATLVTPSYLFDFARCELLVESIRQCAAGLRHVIIVDQPDLARFRSLQGPMTVVIDSRELLDRSFHRLPGGSNWWVSARTLPLRGWMTQQLRKLAIHRIVDTDIVVNVDSDVAFVRPFDAGIFLRGDALSLFAVDYRNDEIIGWSRLAKRMFGISSPSLPMNHVGMMICWWRDRLVDMLDLLESRSGRPWQTLIGRQRTFSEYQTYGTYILDHVGLERARHFVDDRRLIETSWHHDLHSPAAIGTFIADAGPDAIGVMVHSKDGIAPDTYRAHLARHWSRM